MSTFTIRVAACALLAASSISGAQTPPAAVQARYDAAHADYEIGHYQAAFAVFAALADEGRCDAARIATQMLRGGRPLYATEFRAEPERVRRWLAPAACANAVAVRR